MCGIMGYIGPKQALPIVLDGLRRLEYRGYDSAGIAVINEGKMVLKRSTGRLQELIDQLQEGLPGSVGMGHTRWATHGAPTENNAHPHPDQSNTVVVIHNGIIENYLGLKEELQASGVAFRSQTDTEVIPNLLMQTGLPLAEALPAVMQRLKGAYALVILDKRNPEEIWVARQDSPLVIGIGDGENFVASDIPALLPYTRKMVFLSDGERACVRAEGVVFYDREGREITKIPNQITWDADAAEKTGYAHFMLKEIHEQPKALRETMNPRFPSKEQESFFIEMDAEQVPWDWESIQRIVITACGTAYYAGAAGKYFIENLARIPVEIDLASEYRYRDPILDKHTLVVVVSQSGETADTLGALRLAKSKGCFTMAISNVVGSTVSREADYVIYTQAGPEIAVASTKAYSTQVLLLLLFALKLGELKGKLTIAERDEWLQTLRTLPYWVENVLQQGQTTIRDWSESLCGVDQLFLIGRGLDYAVALEGALKLKELAYIHCEAYASGELKHGPLALISPGTPVIALTTQGALLEKTQSNIQVVLARGAKLFHISNATNLGEDAETEQVLRLPQLPDLLMPLLAVGPLQLLAYYTALQRGNDVDKPRNLAKSVTVE